MPKPRKRKPAPSIKDGASKFLDSYLSMTNGLAKRISSRIPAKSKPTTRKRRSK